MEETVAWTTRRHEYPLHEPAGTARGFGVRQSSGAFGSGPRAQKRQRTAAVQDASAPAAASSRFMVPMLAQTPYDSPARWHSVCCAGSAKQIQLRRRAELLQFVPLGAMARLLTHVAFGRQ